VIFPLIESVWEKAMTGISNKSNMVEAVSLSAYSNKKSPLGFCEVGQFI
jgi:hypothetical protein